MNRFVVFAASLFAFPVLAAPTASELKQIKLPPGFSISVFAEIPGARQMTLTPKGTLFVGARDEGAVFAVADAAKLAAQGKTAKPIQIAESLTMPNGVAFKDGTLYVAEVSRILRFPQIEKNLRDGAKFEVLRDDFPTETHHGWKYIAIGPDGWLYVPVGAPCNNCLSENPIYASITRLSLDGKTREIYAKGVRNTVGFDWHPETKELWFTDNGRDQWGDDKPGDELNRAPKADLHFGYPHCHQGDLSDPEFGKGKDCGAKGPYTFPEKVLAPHTAALGMKFYRGKQFPAEYKKKVFIAEHGSWNRSKKIGYRVMTVDWDGSKDYKVFAEGWLQNEDPWGRPVDVLELPDGSLLISDDYAGVIYRVTYKQPSRRG